MTRIILFFAFFLIIHLSSLAQDQYWAFVSSGNAADSVGIGIYDWNAVDGTLIKQYHENAVTSSSYLVINETNEILYSINGKGIQSFQIDKDNGKLSFLNEESHVGKGSCYISMTNDKRFLLIAYYSSGSVATYELKENGEVGGMISHIVHQGSSVNEKRQKSAHAHMIISAAKGNLIYVTDLGTDEIVTYQLSTSGELKPKPISITKTNPGNGPRHLVFHPSKNYVYVLAELTGHVLAYLYDDQKGITNKIGEISILPKNFKDFNKSADIHISKDGRYLYASNRGDNSIAVCEININTGSLKLSDIIDCGGDWPRAFEIDPSGNYLLVANKESDAISLMSIEAENGLFKKNNEIESLLAPQCIKFLKK
ncbi:MAG: lactonase family protein [Reichenbachiella sp.]